MLSLLQDLGGYQLDASEDQLMRSKVEHLARILGYENLSRLGCYCCCFRCSSQLRTSDCLMAAAQASSSVGQSCVKLLWKSLITPVLVDASSSSTHGVALDVSPVAKGTCAKQQKGNRLLSKLCIIALPLLVDDCCGAENALKVLTVYKTVDVVVRPPRPQVKIPTIQLRIPSMIPRIQPVHPVTIDSQQLAMALQIPDIMLPMVATVVLQALLPCACTQWSFRARATSLRRTLSCVQSVKEVRKPTTAAAAQLRSNSQK